MNQTFRGLRAPVFSLLPSKFHIHNSSFNFNYRHVYICKLLTIRLNTLMYYYMFRLPGLDWVSLNYNFKIETDLKHPPDKLTQILIYLLIVVVVLVKPTF